MQTVIDLTHADDPPKTVYVDADSNEMCCLCWDPVEDGTTYWTPPCNHLFCKDCMKDNRLNRCSRCNQEFTVATPVRLLVRNYTVTIE